MQGSGSLLATSRGTAFLQYLLQESQEMAFAYNYDNYLQARKVQQSWNQAARDARQFQHLQVLETACVLVLILHYKK